jgi:hypothetical protein
MSAGHDRRMRSIAQRRRDGRGRMTLAARCAAALMAAAALVTGAAGCSARTAAPAVAHAPHARAASPAARMAAADARACVHETMFPPATADQVMAGRLTIPHFPTVTVDPRRDATIDWSMDPFHHPSWTVYFVSAEWVEPLVDRFLAGGPGAAAYRDRAKALLRDWLREVPLPERNPNTLICSARAFPGQRWIESQIPPQVNYSAQHWIGAWNHGLLQDLALLQIGCAYPAKAWDGQPLRWRAAAVRQMEDSFLPSRLGPAIDTQGATNEQATGYASFAHTLWVAAGNELVSCGYAVPAVIKTRVALMPMFIAQSVQPDGNLVQIGDTYQVPPAMVTGSPVEYAVTRGAEGSPPARRVAVYSAGYVFGRSGWGTARPLRSESFYSLRFGPGRLIHGHDDHMSVTYYARGRNLITGSGHTGYEAGPYRDYLRSPQAQNVLVMPGVRFSGTAATALTRQSIGDSGQFFEFADRAFGGFPRDRSIYISQRPDMMVVLDRASGARRYQQLWHLDPDLGVTMRGRSCAIARPRRDDGTRLWICQVAWPGQVLPPGSIQVMRGQVNPYQGWVSRRMFQRTPASVVAMNRTGNSAAILTVIAPTDRSAPVATRITAQPDASYRLDVRIGSHIERFLVSPGGDITSGLSGGQALALRTARPPASSSTIAQTTFPLQPSGV